MEIIIEWSELSERQLKDIYDYYSIEVSSRTARKVIGAISIGYLFLKAIHPLGPKKNF